jgi:putative nucleotidyltransferase with HDIG domain
MRDNLIEQISKCIQNMPSLPVSVTKVLEICNDPHTRAADLNRVISLDPILVGRVLKLLNSAYYGFGRQVTSLARAIIIVGINTVKNLAVSAAVMSTLPKGKNQGLDTEGFWRHSLCTGVAAKLLAKERGLDPALHEEYFTAGLLHDIGKIPLGAALSSEYILTVAAADRDRIPLFRAEEAALGFNHCAAGAMIVKAWKLTGPVADTIIHHHSLAEYTGDHRDLLYSVAAANRFASEQEIGFSGNRFPEKTGQPIWEFLGASWEVLENIQKTVSEEIVKAQVFLKLQ